MKKANIIYVYVCVCVKYICIIYIYAIFDLYPCISYPHHIICIVFHILCLSNATYKENVHMKVAHKIYAKNDILTMLH